MKKTRKFSKNSRNTSKNYPDFENLPACFLYPLFCKFNMSEDLALHKTTTKINHNSTIFFYRNCSNVFCYKLQQYFVKN